MCTRYWPRLKSQVQCPLPLHPLQCSKACSDAPDVAAGVRETHTSERVFQRGLQQGRAWCIAQSDRRVNVYGCAIHHDANYITRRRTAQAVNARGGVVLRSTIKRQGEAQSTDAGGNSMVEGASGKFAASTQGSVRWISQTPVSAQTMWTRKMSFTPSMQSSSDQQAGRPTKSQIRDKVICHSQSSSYRSCIGAARTRPT